MKKLLFLIGGILSSWAINAQIMQQQEVALLFAQEEINGTARFNAMGGAFGALGGDMSATDINPAGLAIFKNPQASITLGLRNTDIGTSFAGNTSSFDDQFLNIHQAGGVLVFNHNGGDSWRRFAFGVNYSLSNDFNNFYNVSGNVDNIPNNNVGDIFIKGFTDNTGNPIDINLADDPNLNFDSDPNNDIFYNRYENQRFENQTTGKNEKVTFTFAGKLNKKVHLGFSIVNHNVNFYQRTVFDHRANDGNGNTLNSSFLQELRTTGNGAAINLGAIIKPNKETRFGIAYQSPTWYNLTDEFTDNLQTSLSNSNGIIEDDNGVNIAEYDITTPGKLTGSFAYLFGKEGLISFDYTYKDYKNVRLRPTNEFNEINEGLSQDLRSTSQFRIGAEWRIDNISLRGGYLYEQSPFENAIDSDNKEGYSFGLGIKLSRASRLDLAYQNTKNTGVYNFADAQNFPSTELDLRTDKFTATLVIGL